MHNLRGIFGASVPSVVVRGTHNGVLITPAAVDTIQAQIKKVMRRTREIVDAVIPGSGIGTPSVQAEVALPGKKDNALISNPGGVDLNAKKLKMNIKQDGAPIKFDAGKFTVDPNITGFKPNVLYFTPVIPVNNLQIILGVNQIEEGGKISMR
jgi:hypothetical protein